MKFLYKFSELDFLIVMFFGVENIKILFTFIDLTNLKKKVLNFKDQ